MNKLCLLVAGVLTGAAVGLLTGRVELWICLGVVMGAALAVAARRRADPDRNEIADRRRPTADGRF